MKSFLVVLACGLAAAGCASPRGRFIPEELRPHVPPNVNPEHLHFTKAAVAEGRMAPDFTLPRADAPGVLTLSELRGLPVVLAFGSFT